MGSALTFDFDWTGKAREEVAAAASTTPQAPIKRDWPVGDTFALEHNALFQHC